MQQTLERMAESERFNMNALYTVLWPLIDEEVSFSPHLSTIRQRLGAKEYRHLGKALIRHVFLIEPVKGIGVTTTKYRVRWWTELADDPRFCPFAECVEIASSLMEQLTGWLDTAEHVELTQLYYDYLIIHYEVPLDYIERPASTDLTTRIHRRGNLAWTFTDAMLRTVKLRKYLFDPATSPDAFFFKKVLDDKIKVKTYLTDRVLTGENKSNREKRWEVHPRSVHFALRRTSMEIEYVLIRQLCAFAGFPEQFKAQLQAQGILPAELPTYRCPITLEPMSFDAFKDALLNPTHGKSDFQVGHLNPLKLDDPTDTASGHTADNISWISAHGNRIQGPMSLASVRALLQQIAHNYQEQGLV